MLTEAGAFRRWGLRRVALPYPKITAIEIQTHIEDLQGKHSGNQIDLPLLGRASLWAGNITQLNKVNVSAELSSLSVPLQGDRLSLIDAQVGITAGGFELLKRPAQASIRIPCLLEPPVIVDLFDPLRRPRRAGKAYAYSPITKSQPTVLTDDDTAVVQQAKELLGLNWCRHGQIQSQCYICQTESQRHHRRRNQHDATANQTVDVFDLLLPYLQPPLESLLAQPILFPDGRRPYDYQIAGIKFLAAQSGALLGDEMGLGKTIQTIVALQLLYRQGKARQTLILCPRSLLGTWEKEIDKWAPELFVQRVRGNKIERKLKWKAPSAIYLTTYETLRQDIDTVLALKRMWDVAILDEVQKIKNPSTKTSRAIRSIDAKFRWGLSGTPLENKLEDVTAIFSYLVPGLFKSESELTSDGVRRTIQPYFLRRRTADVRTELPGKVSNEIWLNLTTKQLRTYKEIEDAGKQKLRDSGATRVHVFALINELKQICNMEPTSGDSCKADYLEDQLDNIVDSGQKALVFSHLPKVSLGRLQPRLKHYGSEMFDGSLSDSRREQIITNFQENGSPNVLLMSVQAGGVRITLTAANNVFHFDHWWNPAVARQAEGRAHRIGQERTVFVYDIYTNDTIEERIHHLLQDKQALFDNVIDELSIEHVEGAVSDDELFGLFGLRPPTPKTNNNRQPLGTQSPANGTVAAKQTIDGVATVL